MCGVGQKLHGLGKWRAVNMWNYEKRLQYPIKIKNPDPKLAMVIMSQFGGPDGELAASMRYLSQRYVMPYREVAGLLTDIGTEAYKMFQKKRLAFIGHTFLYCIFGNCMIK